jgi:hypothetical protein
MPIKNGKRVYPCPEYCFSASSQLGQVLYGLFGYYPTRLNSDDLPLLTLIQNTKYPILSEVIDKIDRHKEIEIWQEGD